MKIVSDKLKEALKQPTTQRKGRILVNGNYYEVYNVEYYADVYNEGNVIGNAIASQLDFDLPYMAKFDSFKYFDGVWTGRDYEFIDMGTFTVVDEKDEDEFNKHITSFDNLIKFNAPFEDKKDYPKTLFQELQNICSQAGVELENTSIVNGNFIVENNQFAAGENLKTVLKNICGVSGTYATIKNDKLVLQLQNKTNEVMNKGQHEPIEWKRKTYGINQVVLGLKDVGGEYVVKQDDEDIAINGVHKLVINDNYFAYTQEKRQQLINELFEQVKGFGYIPYELKGEWLNYMDVGDTITIDGIETIVLRINGKSPKGLESIMSSPAIIDSAIEYVNNTNAIENRIKRTEIKVDKYDQKINLAVETAQEAYDKVEVYNPVLEAEGNGQLSLPDSAGEELLEFTVDGKSEQNGTPTPSAPIDIKSISGVENLLNISEDNHETSTNASSLGGTTIGFSDSGYTVDATSMSSGGGRGDWFYVPLTIGKTYVIKYKTDGNFTNVRIFKKNKTTVFINSEIAEGEYTYTFTAEEDGAYFRTWTNGGKTATLDYAMITRGTIAYPYVPYGTNYLIEKVVGKNKFDKTKAQQNTRVNGTNGTIGNYPGAFSSDYIDVSKFKSVIISGLFDYFNITGSGHLYALYDSNKNYIGGIGSQPNNNDTLLVNIPSNCKYIKFNGVLANIDKVKLEEGSQATEYEEYKETIYLIDLKGNKLCSIGDVKDELIVKNGQATIDKKIWKVVLDGSENWYKQGGLYFTINQKNINIQKDINPIFKSNIGNISYGVLDSKTGFGLAYAYGWRINLKDINAYNGGTVAQIKEWLRQNPVTVYYVLATPETIDLGEVSIQTLQSDCTLTLEEELDTDMYAKYIKNNPYNEAYSTRLDTKAQIQLSENKIESSVSETILQNTELMQGEIDSLSSNLANNYMTSEEVKNLNNLTNESLAVITNEFKQIQTSTQTQFQAITNILQNGVNLVKTTYTTIDDEGIKIAKSTDSFNSTFDNRGLKLYSYTDLMAVYTNRGAAVSNLLVTGTMDLGYSKIMKVTLNGKKYTGIFYSDAMAQTLEDFVED